MKKNNEVLVAEVVCAHGIRGYIKARFHTENSRNLEKLNTFFAFDGKSNQKIELKIVKGLEKNIAICSVKIDGKIVDNRNVAEEISKSKIYVNRNDLPKIEEDDTFYIVDLIGLEVRDDAGISIGKISGVFDFGAGDIIEIKLNNSKEITYPFKNEFFPEMKDDFVVLKMSKEDKSHYLESK